MAKIKPPDPARLLHDLEHSKELKPEVVAEVELDPQLVLLRAWQSDRLASTYADLLADKRYSPACHFFLADIYAPCDFSQRDHDLKQIHTYLSRVVPVQMLQLLTDTVELNELTSRLDRDLLRVLVDRLGVVDTITPQLYAQSYRVCDNYIDRKYQIDLTTRLLKEVAEGARLAVVGLAMKVVHGPAERAGLQGGRRRVQAANRLVVIGGDILTAIDGVKLKSVDDLTGYLDARRQVGDMVRLDILREGRPLVVQAKLGELPDE